MPSVCCAVLCPCCCPAGAQRQFTRRKQDAVCVQGGDYKRPQPTSKPCACTAADVECDYGYVRSGSDGTCKALPHVSRVLQHARHLGAVDAVEVFLFGFEGLHGV